LCDKKAPLQPARNIKTGQTDTYKDAPFHCIHGCENASTSIAIVRESSKAKRCKHGRCFLFGKAPKPKSAPLPELRCQKVRKASEFAMENTHFVVLNEGSTLPWSTNRIRCNLPQAIRHVVGNRNKTNPAYIWESNSADVRRLEALAHTHTQRRICGSSTNEVNSCLPKRKNRQATCLSHKLSTCKLHSKQIHTRGERQSRKTPSRDLQRSASQACWALRSFGGFKVCVGAGNAMRAPFFRSTGLYSSGTL